MNDDDDDEEEFDGSAVTCSDRSSWPTGCYRSSAFRYRTKESTSAASRTVSGGARPRRSSSFTVRIASTIQYSISSTHGDSEKRGTSTFSDNYI